MSTNQQKRPDNDQKPNTHFWQRVKQRSKSVVHKIRKWLKKTVTSIRHLGIAFGEFLKKVVTKQQTDEQNEQSTLNNHEQTQQQKREEQQLTTEGVSDTEVGQVNETRLPDNSSNQPQTDLNSNMTTHEQAKQTEDQQHKNDKRRRRFPIWLRLVVVVIFSIVALFAGAVFGYGVMGDGKPFDAMHKSTWEHIIHVVVEEK